MLSLQVYVLLLTRLPILSNHWINALSFNCYICYQMLHKLFWVSVWQLLTIHVWSLSVNLENLYSWNEFLSSLLIYGDLNYYYSVIYQPSLFAIINSRYIYAMHLNLKFWKVTVKQFSSGQGILILFRWCWHWLGLQGKQLWIGILRQSICCV